MESATGSASEGSVASGSLRRLQTVQLEARDSRAMDMPPPAGTASATSPGSANARAARHSSSDDELFDTDNSDYGEKSGMANFASGDLEKNSGIDVNLGEVDNENAQKKLAKKSATSEGEKLKPMLFRQLEFYEDTLSRENLETGARGGRWRQSFCMRLWTTLQDEIGALYIYLKLTCSFESLLVLANAIGATIFFLEYEDDEGTLIAAKLDMSFLAFSVTFPLTYLMGQAFGRREQALQHAADFRSVLTSIVCGSLIWDFPSAASKEWGGRAELPDWYNRYVRDTAVEMAELLYQYLSIPWITGRARNYVFKNDGKRVQEVVAKRSDIEQRFAVLFRRLYTAVETMKATGMPGNESSRLAQYIWFLQQRINLLRNQKVYRTPQATRSFGRVYLFVLPWFIGPYFAWIYEQSGSYGMAIAISCLTFLVLMGLITAGRALEDPFIQENGFDNIKLQHDVALLIQCIDYHYDRAEEERDIALEERAALKNGTS